MEQKVMSACRCDLCAPFNMQLSLNISKIDGRNGALCQLFHRIVGGRGERSGISQKSNRLFEVGDAVDGDSRHRSGLACILFWEEHPLFPEFARKQSDRESA